MHRLILILLVAVAVAAVALERDDFETWQYLYKRNPMHGAKRTELNQLNSVLKKPVYNFMRIFGYRDQ